MADIIFIVLNFESHFTSPVFLLFQLMFWEITHSIEIKVKKKK